MMAELTPCLDSSCIGVLSKRRGVWYCPACKGRWGRGPVPTAVYMLEKEFAQTVVDMATTIGWLVYRTWSSIRSPKGFPDLTMVKGDRLVFAELKAEDGYCTPDQEVWLEALRQTGKAEVYLWKPSDLEEIERVLGQAGDC